jgi:replicative DNA helicase
MSDQPLPAKIDMERLLLGNVLLTSGAMMDGLRSTLEVDDFALAVHQELWRMMCDLYDAEGKFDHMTVGAELERRGRIQAIPPSYLSELQDGCPILPCLDKYVDELKDRALLRKIITFADNVGKRAFSGTETGQGLWEAIGQMHATFADVGAKDERPLSAKELGDLVGIDGILNPSTEGGVKLPWSRLNYAVQGGLRGGQDVVIAADTGRGKTSMACQIATHALRQGFAVHYCTLEMPKREIYRKIVTQIIGGRVWTREGREKEREAYQWVYEQPIIFDDTARTVPALCAHIRQTMRRVKLGLVVVDHLGHLRSAGRAESRTREVGENSRSLKLAALDFDLPFLVLSQFHRGPGDERSIHSLKESGDIENDADLILLVDMAEISGDSPATCSIHIGKQRQGPSGFNVPMVFHPVSQTFESVEENGQ